MSRTGRNREGAGRDNARRPGDPAISEPVARQAAEWFLLLQSGQATAIEQAQAARWREADAAHETAWQRAEQIMGRLQALPAALAMPTLGRRGQGRRRSARTLALLIAGGPLAWAGWHQARSAGWMAEHRTATGEQREVILADGSRLVLNTATAVDLFFDARERRVRLLRGEILVETASSSATLPSPLPSLPSPSSPPSPPSPTAAPPRPADGDALPAFVVETSLGRIQALGTRFLVRDLGDRCRVSVLEGAVHIQPDDRTASPLLLTAGNQAAFTHRDIGRVEALPPDPDSWRRAVLRVDDLRLDAFVAELARYRPGILRCDPAVAGLRISGSFQLRDTDPVLASLAQALPLAIHYRTRYWVTIAPAGSPRRS